MKIFIGQLGHETNTFSSDRTDILRFGTGGYCEGEELKLRYTNSNHYLGGMIKAGIENNVELFYGISIATAGPLITRDCLDYYINKLINSLLPYANSIDGICLALHGGGCAEGVDDIEGYTLRCIRDIVGMGLPITMTLDLHGNISEEMVKLADGIFAIKQYPHIDCDKAGYLAMKSLIRYLNKEIKMKMHFIKLPMLIPFDLMATTGGIGKQLMDFVESVKTENGLIDTAFFHGYPYADTPLTGSGVLVVSENDSNVYAQKIAEVIWSNKSKLYPRPVGVIEAVDNALSLIEGNKTVILCETSDHGGGGGPNDGTHVLRELLNRDIPESILASICDPEVAEKAHSAGLGADIEIVVGGKKDKVHGDPIHLNNVKVLGLSDGNFFYTTPMYLGLPYSIGNTARLQSGNVEFVVCTVPRQTHDDRMLAITGAQVSDYRLVAIKSTNAFRAYYEPLSYVKAIVMTNPPGVSSSDFTTLQFKNIKRPIYPLDQHTTLGDVIEYHH